MSQDVKQPLDNFKHVSLFWTDLLHLMSGKPIALTSVGPMRNWANDMKKIMTEAIDSYEDIIEFNQRLTEYYKQLSETWLEAQKKVNAKMPSIPQDSESLEAYKRIWIDIFENDFTGLFDSEKFALNYGKMVSSELEITKHWENMLNVMLNSARLPTRKEIDEIYKELHELRKRVKKLERREKQDEK
ncbi:poly(R)-hydroxyalkanoic acid synthase subunit PhaE [Candidatus Nitrosotenuis uzonensis]|uniref:Poly(3-hydroxyalkanoate) polymerase subunit PhaE n=1 Tax=Candidatus Nitrosotenuis uzonensis TaxID=1407055 RepID=V6AT06_9ARCH|nr:poly(R)-hydroxyalkanoic acid synthase subunit PhaE [Candidatus Nitrosotenuis uzonensis]CDI05777.1 putative poly(3-hydroxyalkanoate) synthase component [Candidatus Nitrosotenuis uzonensis]